jgi:hypothetical protein
VIVDRTTAGFQVSPQVFSPNNDGRLDTTRFSFTLDKPARVTLTFAAGRRRSARSSRASCRLGCRRSTGTAASARGVGEHEFRADLRVTSPVATVTSTVRSRPTRPAEAETRVPVAASLLDQRAGRRDGRLRRDEDRDRAPAAPGKFTFPPAARSRRSRPSPGTSPATTAGRSGTRSRDPAS